MSPDSPFSILIPIGVVCLVYLVSLWSRMRGSIDIFTEKDLYVGGETIQGKVVVNLKKPLHATQLSVSLIESRYEYSTASRSRVARTVYTDTSVLGEETDYFRAEFPFALVLPSRSLAANIPELRDNPIAQAVVNFTSSLKSQNPSSWSLHATLNIPNALDLESIQAVHLKNTL